MKKFLTMLALAGVMTACNDGDDDTDDEDTMAVDTSAMSTPLPADTTHMGDTSKMSGDTSTMKK
jgi:hypothetical protein